MLTRTQFLEYLRKALDNLYQPDRLGQSPLAGLLGVAGRPDTFSALQRVLIEAIEALEPRENVPTSARAWRIYDLLSCRYLQGLDVPTTAHQLGVSERHLRREQSAAIEALGFQLWGQYHLEEIATELPEAAKTGNDPVGTTELLTSELTWIREASPEQPVNLEAVLTSVVNLVGPMAQAQGVKLAWVTEGSLPFLAVHPVVVEQILINIITLAIHCSRGGRVVIQVWARKWEVEVQLSSAERNCWRSLIGADSANLTLTHQLLDMVGGRIRLSEAEEAFRAALFLPTFEQLPVVVIDDNADALHLFQRYAAGTRYHLVTTQDPSKVLELVQQHQAAIVVLDIMMPQIDGWRLLGQIRQYPLENPPIILVCSILPQEDLAISLGANGLIRKPVTREAFLAALDRQAALLEPPLR